MLYAAAGKTKKDREQLCFAVFFGTIKRAFKAASRLRLNVARFNKNLFRRKKGMAPRQEKSLSFMPNVRRRVTLPVSPRAAEF